MTYEKQIFRQNSYPQGFAVWKLENGITVSEEGYADSESVHNFEVCDDKRFLGVIAPATLEEMKHCIDTLDSGNIPENLLT